MWNIASRVRLLICYTVSLIFFHSYGWGQVQNKAGAWFNAFKSSGISMVRTSPDGFVLFTGPSLFWFDTTGNPQALKRYLTTGTGQGRVIRAANGNLLVLLAHSTVGPGNGDALLFRMDSSGLIVWIRAYGTAAADVPARVAELPDGTILMLLSAEGVAGPQKNMVLSAVNQWGDQRWHRVYRGDEGPVTASAMLCTPEGDVYLAGYTAENSVLVKTDTTGHLKWSRSYPGFFLQDMSRDPASGDLYLCGFTLDSAAIPGEQAVLIRQDTSAQIRWQRSLPNANGIRSSVPLCLTYDAVQQRIYCGGKIYSDQFSVEYGQAMALTFDQDGELLSAFAAGGNGEESFQDVLVTDFQTTFWSGYTNSFGTDSTILLINGAALTDNNCLSSTILCTPDTNRIVLADPGYQADTASLDVVTYCFPPQTETPAGRSLCTTISIEEQPEPSSLRGFPNPSNGRFCFKLNGEMPRDWAVYDITGRRIRAVQYEVSDGMQCLIFDSAAPSGLYFLRLQHEDAVGNFPITLIR